MFKKLIINLLKKLFIDNPKSTIKGVGYIISIIVIIFVLKYFGCFKETIIQNPITPGPTTNLSKPSKDSGEILVNIQNMIDFINKRANEKN